MNIQRSITSAANASWLQRVDARTDPGRHRHRRTRTVRLLQPQYSILAGPRGRGSRPVRRQRHFPDRVVPARPGRADRQVQARTARPRRQPLRLRRHGGLEGPGLQRRRPSKRSSASSRSPSGPDGLHPGTRLGPAPRRGRLRHHRRLPPEQVHANAAASGVTLSDDLLSAVDRALGDAPLTEPTLAPSARQPAPLRVALGSGIRTGMVRRERGAWRRGRAGLRGSGVRNPAPWNPAEPSRAAERAPAGDRRSPGPTGSPGGSAPGRGSRAGTRRRNRRPHPALRAAGRTPAR
ncbi:hypothetical protein STENM327S_07827 [Streptomyces tendae]